MRRACNIRYVPWWRSQILRQGAHRWGGNLYLRSKGAGKDLLDRFSFNNKTHFGGNP